MMPGVVAVEAPHVKIAYEVECDWRLLREAVTVIDEGDAQEAG